MVPGIAAGACALGLAVLLRGVVTGSHLLRSVGKVGASLAMVGFGLAVGLADRGDVGLFALLALGLSFVGDVLLLWSDKRVFLVGLVAFLLAHVAYTVAFALSGVDPRGLIVGAGLLVPFAAAVGWALYPKAGRLGKAVVAYISVISCMVCAAAGTVPLAGSVLLVGATLFFVSDLFVARQRFISDVPLNRLIGLPLYYAGQLVIAWGLAR